MKSRKIPMTAEEFQLAEFPFGWKVEYCDGFAYYTPRSHGVLMKTAVAPQAVKARIEIQPIFSVTFEDLCELFYAAFADSVEFCDYPKNEIKISAQRNLKDFFNGERGIPQAQFCRAAIVPKRKKSLVGTCLISKYKYGFKNEILFVRPQFQGKGIGTALVSSVINDLYAAGENCFWSEYHICNRQSANWHRKFGFTEEPDIMTAKFRFRFLQKEVWRNEQFGKAKKIKELKPLLKKAAAEVERLKEIEKKDFDAAWLKWKYDY
jgi:RimJ/RimL family protein N-acetyltransferase